jgi:hypothetical protein
MIAIALLVFWVAGVLVGWCLRRLVFSVREIVALFRGKPEPSEGWDLLCEAVKKLVHEHQIDLSKKLLAVMDEHAAIPQSGKPGNT